MLRRALTLIPLAAAVGACGTDDAAKPTTAQGTATPTPAALTTPAPTPRGRYLTAHLAQPAWLRATPDGRRLHRLRPKTEFGSPTVLGVLERRGGWLKVLSPHLPNGRHGWVTARLVALGGTNFSIHVDRSARRLTLRHGDRTLRRLPVAIGRPGNETPLGRFAVTDKLKPTDPTSPYGCCALALSGHQPKLVPGWPGGDRLAIHGTPAAGSIGQAASLGCLRAPEKDLRVMLRQVPLGTPVFIRA